jgi:ABC-2 type transport system permease protein
MPIGTSAAIAVAWCLGIAVLGFAWSLRLYERLPERPSA